MLEKIYLKILNFFLHTKTGLQRANFNNCAQIGASNSRTHLHHGKGARTQGVERGAEGMGLRFTAFYAKIFTERYFCVQ